MPASPRPICPPTSGATTRSPVTPRGLSKWIGVEVCCERLGVDPARVLAIGDGPNDVELLTAASVAVAPADAHAAALAVADHVVPTPTDGGWARILDLV